MLQDLSGPSPQPGESSLPLVYQRLEEFCLPPELYHHNVVPEGEISWIPILCTQAVSLSLTRLVHRSLISEWAMGNTSSPEELACRLTSSYRAQPYIAQGQGQQHGSWTPKAKSSLVRKRRRGALAGCQPRVQQRGRQWCPGWEGSASDPMGGCTCSPHCFLREQRDVPRQKWRFHKKVVDDEKGEGQIHALDQL